MRPPLNPEPRTLKPFLVAGIVAVNPFMIYFSGLLLTETLFTAMLAWAMVLMVGGRVQGSGFRVQGWFGSWVHWSVVAGGAILALSILVRPSGIFLPLLLGAGALWLNRGGGRAYQQGGGSLPLSDSAREGSSAVPAGITFLVLGLLVLVVLLPWSWRNYRVLEGRWIWMTTNDGITQYDGFNPRATGASDQWFVEEMPWLSEMDEVERSRYFSHLASQYIQANPQRVAELTALKIARTWSPVPLSPQYGGLTIYTAAGLVYSLPFYLLACLGLWKGRLSRRAKLFLLLPALYFTMVHAASVGSLRYRIPAEPPITILVVAGCERLAAAARSGRTTPEAP